MLNKILDYFKSKNADPSHRKLARSMWGLFFLGIIGAIAFFFWLSFQDLPSLEELENPNSNLATQVFGSTGEVIGRYYTENRVEVAYEDLSPHLVHALLATEDERFHEHSGIDFKALGRTVVKTVMLGDDSAGGASTISQQLSKLLFTGQRAKNKLERGFQKFKEWIIAVRLERRFTKEEIIAKYLNKFNFINGAYGIKAASETYFGKPQDELELQEAAMLIGMLKNPSLFNPRRFQDTTAHRRMIVLSQMQRNGYITQAEYDSLKAVPLGLKFSRRTHDSGLAPYFRQEVAEFVKREVLNKKENYKSDGKPYNIYRDGLKIYTTVDPKMQKIAEEEMVKHMTKVQKAFWNTWTRWKRDPWTYKEKNEDKATHEIPVEVRQRSLTKLIRASDRYQSLRRKYLGDLLEELKRFDVRFHEDDRELERIVREHKGEKVISKLVAQKMISKNLAAGYREVVKSDMMPYINDKWTFFQKMVESEFAKPTKMRVFAYNEKMEKDTTLSPLDSIKYHRMFIQTGIVAMDPKNGHVKAWVGGINHKYFKYDHVRADRQVGSTFKPFVYATAIEQLGFSPCQKVYDIPYTIKPEEKGFYVDKAWTPENSRGEYSGELYTLQEGLRKSKNTVSVYLMKEIGSVGPVITLVEKMGIEKKRVPAVPSICLGATDLTVMEMTGAYTTFANNGLASRPVFITKVEDKNGRVLYDNAPSDLRAIGSVPNHVMVSMLQESGGLSGQLKSQVGGKTGTTNDYVDGWFMGFTPDLVVGTWAGGEDRWVRFLDINYGQGAFMAKPFFRNFIKRLEKEENIDYDYKKKFYKPGAINIEMDCSKYSQEDPLKEGDEDAPENIYDDNDPFGDEFGFGDEEEEEVVEEEDEL